MITCPECGQRSDDDARFCERCGQGLLRNAAQTQAHTLPPLAPSAQLKGGFRIVELISQSSIENRYRAERERAGRVERFQLRERAGSDAMAENAADPAAEASPTVTATQPEPADEDPNGPRAKTAELRYGASPAEPPRAGENASSTGPGAQTNADGKRNGGDTCDEAEGSNGDLVERSAARDSAHKASESVAGEGGDSGGDHARLANDPEAADEAVDAKPSRTPMVLTEEMAEEAPVGDAANAVNPEGALRPEEQIPEEAAAVPREDIGEVFGRVLALSLTLNHPAFQRACEGFADGGRVYLAYPDEQLTPLSRRPGGVRMNEAQALNVAIQVCQAVSFVNRRGLRLNDICPESIAYAADRRIKVMGLECVSNDLELQTEPIFNDGYTAPEIYRAKKVDKRADVFSIGALLYTCLTGERLESESWREETGPIRFYPPHVVTPALEQAVRRALVFDPAQRWANVDALKAELVRLNGMIRLRAGVLTDVGMVRELNEDSVMAAEYQRDSLVEPAQSFLYVVADGMGGAEAGETASAIAVGAIRHYVENGLSERPVSDLAQLLKDALEEANTKIIDYQTSHPESRGMGSTAVGTLIVPPNAAVAWVGDSRAYMCDDSGQLRQVTKDHSLVQRLIEIGQISPEEARHHEHKNVITRSLGARQSGAAGAEALGLKLKRGDCLLLCSDGLTTHVEDSQIAEVLHRHVDPMEAARELVVTANAGGGTDNVSVVVIFAG